MTGATRLTIGYIPLADAAALIVAADKDFAAEEGLEIELVREVSWSNVRDKLNIGLFDGAHLLAPLAVASSLGIGHIRVPMTVPFNLALNGNAITVSPALGSALEGAAEGDLAAPAASARALARVVAQRKAEGLPPLTFAMTFPFSHHNYLLRFWMAAGGVVPDDDIQLVVLPPPYMAESLGNGHVDGFCVGAPWNSTAVDLGIGRILHFGAEIMARTAEKVLARCAANGPTSIPTWWRGSCVLSTAPQRSLPIPPTATRWPRWWQRRRVLPSRPRSSGARSTASLELDSDGRMRANDRYLVVGRLGASRPDPVQAAWAYAQMVRWGQAPLSPELLSAATETFRPDLYEAAVGTRMGLPAGEPADGIGAFAGPAFDARDIASHLAGWSERPS